MKHHFHIGSVFEMLSEVGLYFDNWAFEISCSAEKKFYSLGAKCLSDYTPRARIDSLLKASSRKEYELWREKTNNLDSDKVWHKPCPKATEDG